MSSQGPDSKPPSRFKRVGRVLLKVLQVWEWGPRLANRIWAGACWLWARHDAIEIRLALVLMFGLIAFVVAQPLIWNIRGQTLATWSTELGVVMGLVVAILALAAVGIGALDYYILRERLETRLTSVAREREAQFLNRIYAGMGLLYWRQYLPSLSEKINAKGFGAVVDDKEAEAALESALHCARMAMEAVSNLDEIRFEGHVCHARNNLAYHLASRAHDNDREEALRHARYVNDRAANYSAGYGWKETYAWVLARFARGEQTLMERAKSIVVEITGDEDIPSVWQITPEWQQEVCDRYAPLFSEGDIEAEA